MLYQQSNVRLVVVFGTQSKTSMTVSRKAKQRHLQTHLEHSLSNVPTLVKVARLLRKAEKHQLKRVARLLKKVEKHRLKRVARLQRKAEKHQLKRVARLLRKAERHRLKKVARPLKKVARPLKKVVTRKMGTADFIEQMI